MWFGLRSFNHLFIERKPDDTRREERFNRKDGIDRNHGIARSRPDLPSLRSLRERKEKRKKSNARCQLLIGSNGSLTNGLTTGQLPIGCILDFSFSLY